jgi:hypothetical protein
VITKIITNKCHFAGFFFRAESGVFGVFKEKTGRGSGTLKAVSAAPRAVLRKTGI